MDVADMDAIMAAMEQPVMTEAMDHDGALPEPLVLLVEVNRRGAPAASADARFNRDCAHP
jgi:hypothetical protein